MSDFPVLISRTRPSRAWLFLFCTLLACSDNSAGIDSPFPNQPVGLTRFAELDFSAPPNGSAEATSVWHQFEAHMKLNDLGQANGVWQWWLDGVLIGSYSTVVFRTAAYPGGFMGRRKDPIWGGTGGTAKSRTDNLWLDHMYLSGLLLGARQ